MVMGPGVRWFFQMGNHRLLYCLPSGRLPLDFGLRFLCKQEFCRICTAPKYSAAIDVCFGGCAPHIVALGGRWHNLTCKGCYNRFSVLALGPHL